MKKIKRLSLYMKKKAPEVDEINEEDRESAQTKQSPTKSQFGYSLRKKFFSGRSFHRSHSLPEGNGTVTALNSSNAMVDASTDTNGPINPLVDDVDELTIGDSARKVDSVYNSNTYSRINGVTTPTVNICAGDGAERDFSLKSPQTNNIALVTAETEQEISHSDNSYTTVNSDNFLSKRNSYAEANGQLSNSTVSAATNIQPGDALSSVSNNERTINDVSLVTNNEQPANVTTSILCNEQQTNGHLPLASDVKPVCRKSSSTINGRSSNLPAEGTCTNTPTLSLCETNTPTQPSPSADQKPQVSTSPRNGLSTDRHNILTEFQHLAQQGWYWGPLTRLEAEDKLEGTPEGSFLVRDSSDDRYLLSLSFRSFGRTLHTRIEHSAGKFSFYINSGVQSYKSVVELIADSVRDSQEAGVFCYSRSRNPRGPTLPVRLMYPVSRLSQVRSLQYLCRFVIRQFTRIDHIEKLPLPKPVKGYLNEKYF